MDGFVDDPRAEYYDKYGRIPPRPDTYVFYSCDNYEAVEAKRGDFSLGLSESEQFRARKAQLAIPS